MEAVTTKKIRHSDVRDRIYEYLCGTKAHPSANTIYNDLKPSIPKLSLGTVYTNLKLFEELGQVKILERAECKHVPFHALRHTFATQMLRYGMDIKTLASTIGHESVETTLNIYSHTTDEGMRQAAERIDRAMG